MIITLKAMGKMNEMDWRNITSGNLIPSESYSDQPYVVITADGAWLCTLTTGVGEEGESGQHVCSMRSVDQGVSWSKPLALETPGEPESSYSVLLRLPSGRVYCFYNHNTDNVRQVKADDPPFNGGWCSRVDSLGHFVFKYSDDHGLSWSEKRYDIPMRMMEIDRKNPYGGELKFFWNVGRPFIRNGCAFVPLTKVGGFGKNFFTSNEGVLLMSPNLCTEQDPERIIWETLPEGELGIRAPKGGGAIAAEHCYTVLSDNSIFCVFRTIDGSPGCAYSRDGGRSWSPSRYMTYGKDRRVFRHPRAANFIWKTSKGKYLYWFHNHGGKGYDDRNPAWICGGIEEDSPDGRVIRWSEPELLLYDDDPRIRISYPDMIEDNGRFYFTETQKNMARTHEIPAAFLEAVWNGMENTEEVAVTNEPELLLNQSVTDGEVKAPVLPEFCVYDYASPDYRGLATRKGFSLEMLIRHENIGQAEMLISGFNREGRGIGLALTSKGELELIMDDGSTRHCLRSEACIVDKKPAHAVINIDGGPHIVSFIVNGNFCDGGGQCQFGWKRFSPWLSHVNWTDTWTLGAALKQLRVFGRVLMTAEAVTHCRRVRE